MRARIYKLASRLTRVLRANPFAVCVLVLITFSAVLVPQNTRAMPQNPFTSRDGILRVPGATFPLPNNSQPYGWMYSPSTGHLVANVEGVGSDGVLYVNY
jgi:hypothetical protein